MTTCTEHFPPLIITRLHFLSPLPQTNEAVIHYQLAASNAAVVPIRELVLSRKRLGFVMEYMSGGTLQSFVEAQKRLDEDMAAYLFRQVLMAVEKCHVHRVAYRCVTQIVNLCTLQHVIQGMPISVKQSLLADFI